MKTVSLLVFLSLSIFKSNAQELKWTTFSHLNDSLRKEPKPLLIFIHTDWCKYCLMQEQTTFTDSTIVKTLNENYYCLKLNAESQKNIIFLGRTYKGYINDTHELAHYLNEKGKPLSFPSTIITSKNHQVVFRQSGLTPINDLKKVLLED